MKYLVLLISIFSIGCADGERGGDSSNPYAALFRLWTEPNSGHQVDMRAAHFGWVPYVLSANGKSCHCKLDVSGFINQGDLQIRACALDGISSDSDCDALNRQWTYEMVSNGSLKLCEKPAGPCAQYY